MVSLSTVGYGDLSPKTKAARLFCAAFLLVGTAPHTPIPPHAPSRIPHTPSHTLTHPLTPLTHPYTPLGGHCRTGRRAHFPRAAAHPREKTEARAAGAPGSTPTLQPLTYTYPRVPLHPSRPLTHPHTPSHTRIYSLTHPQVLNQYGDRLDIEHLKDLCGPQMRTLQLGQPSNTHCTRAEFILAMLVRMQSPNP